MDFPFPVNCINCNEKQLKCKVSSQSKGSCHRCLQNGIDVFSLWRRWWRRQQWSSSVSVFIHSSAIVLIAPNATDNARTTIASHNPHAVPSAGFLFKINYHHKKDVILAGQRGSATSAACRTTRQRSDARRARGEGVSRGRGTPSRRFTP